MTLSNRTISAEFASLEWEIMSEVPGIEWEEAASLASSELCSLLEYAASWDASAVSLGNESAVCPF